MNKKIIETIIGADFIIIYKKITTDY